MNHWSGDQYVTDIGDPYPYDELFPAITAAPRPSAPPAPPAPAPPASPASPASSPPVDIWESAEMKFLIVMIIVVAIFCYMRMEMTSMRYQIKLLMKALKRSDH